MKVLIFKLDDHNVDKQGHIIPTDAKISFEPIIPVYLDFDKNKPLGEAKIERDGNDFYAYIDEKIENLESLTPAIGGRIDKKHVEDYDVIDALTITELSLQVATNCDERILSVREQIGQGNLI